MSKALLQKNTRSLLLWLPLVLLGCSLLFYAMLRMHARHMQEKQLLLKQSNIWTAFTARPESFARYVQGEYDIREVKNTPNINLESRDTIIYFRRENQSLLFQVSSAYKSWNGKTYLLSVYVSSREIDHLIIKVFLTEAAILALLLLTVIIVNKRSSLKLWTPFFSTIQQVKQYDITQNANLSLPSSTGTTEFDELNKEVSFLIGKVNKAYLQQKQFVENASHEMQTPLAIIRSKLELLINQPDLTENTAALLGDITDANDRLSQMNRTLLLLAKIENNQFPEVEEVKIVDLLHGLIDNYRSHYDGGFPELTEDIHSPATVTANRSLLEILLSNLIKNAIEHNQQNGAIAIHLRNSEFSIKNTGAEPQTNPELLFERFKKGSDQNNTTGLGLALVRQICLLYHYSIKYTYKDNWHEVRVNFHA